MIIVNLKNIKPMNVDEVLSRLEQKYPGEKEYLQAVKEVLVSIEEVYNAHPEFEKAKLIERLVEPERIITFRVPWVDDKGEVHVNTGYRVQFNSAIGPYKGGLRFHASVTPSILKFLGFEQTFKNALTTLPMGGGKGGSDFSPRGKSDAEIMRFCHAFMSELYHYIGVDEDVPAGDIGVGTREIGYLFGMYKKLKHQWGGVLTGKGIEWGGSKIRPEATGYGALYFVNEMLQTKGIDIAGKIITTSGFGNVTWGVIKKATELGAKVVTISGPDGFIGEKPWRIPCDIALTCATQNELNEHDAELLLQHKPLCVAEVSNMGCTAEAVDLFLKANQLFAPGKAVNAGGVATSGLEITQNNLRLPWSEKEVDEKLHYIMHSIHEQCGANVAGFMKVANAMMAQGIV